MAAHLGDDGTMDTVIYCSECGEEARYNYEPPWDADLPLDHVLSEKEAKEDYTSFIEWCLEAFASEHECDHASESEVPHV